MRCYNMTERIENKCFGFVLLEFGNMVIWLYSRGEAIIFGRGGRVGRGIKQC